MKKWVLTLVIIIVVALSFNYFYSQFSLTLTSSLSRETLTVGENYYLGYGLQWRGFFSPRLLDVRLRQGDGGIIDRNHEQLEVVPFIDVNQYTGTLDEEAYLEYASEGLIDYVPVRDARIEDNNLLVLRINLKDEGYIDTVDAMIFDYRILGIPRRQVIEFGGLLRY